MRFNRALAVSFACAALVPASPAAARVYDGAPRLALTAAVVQAGGGPQHFDARLLLRALAGPALPAELAALRRRHGAAAVRDFTPTFTFAIDDALRVATRAGVRLPAQPSPSPANRPALVAALWSAGRAAGGSWDVGVMLERLISHPVHHAIMRDIDADPRFGPARNASFHVLLTEAMHDLARAQHVN